jgi:hypothetical protein
VGSEGVPRDLRHVSLVSESGFYRSTAVGKEVQFESGVCVHLAGGWLDGVRVYVLSCDL